MSAYSKGATVSACSKGATVWCLPVLKEQQCNQRGVTKRLRIFSIYMPRWHHTQSASVLTLFSTSAVPLEYTLGISHFVKKLLTKPCQAESAVAPMIVNLVQTAPTQQYVHPQCTKKWEGEARRTVSLHL